ncbi:hypothetical protein [Robertmurraya sp.]|uniref:hypothetical protein n=1 Tax=Robertmurraya sp. TaxID=2837525 RepID=UPI003703DA65
MKRSEKREVELALESDVFARMYGVVPTEKIFPAPLWALVSLDDFEYYLCLIEEKEMNA